MSEHQPTADTFSWVPHPGPQTAFVNIGPEYREVLFGGARGGGKSDGLIGLAGKRALTYGPNFHAVIFRKTYKQLGPIIKRAQQVYSKHGAEYRDKNRGFTFPNGALIEFSYLDDPRDHENYQGWSLQLIGFEELTNWADDSAYNYLKGTLREKDALNNPVPCQIISTANPGGPGHQWVKARFIDPAPGGWKKIVADVGRGRTSSRIYIPSRVSDNPSVGDDYLEMLAQTGSPAQVRAWLDGDWSVITGAFFTEFDTKKHIIPRKTDWPDHWYRFMSGDWGFSAPFAFYWCAIASEDYQLDSGKVIPKGAMVVYREYYGIEVNQFGDFVPNKGARLFAEEVGRQIALKEKDDAKIKSRVIDPSCFQHHGGFTTAELIMRGIQAEGGKTAFSRADNTRIGNRGAMAGWDSVRMRLAGAAPDPKTAKSVNRAEARPMIYFTTDCVHLIRTLPALQHDERNPEDMDTTGEDHAADAIRYACMSRPYIRPSPPVSKTKLVQDLTYNDLTDSIAQKEAPRRALI